MLAEQSFSRYDCIPHTPDFYALSSIGIWERLSMSGYSPMGKSDKFNNLAIAYSPIPYSISLGLGNKKNNPERNIQSGFQVHSHLFRGSHSGGGYIAIYNLPLITETFSECDWIIISLANIATFYKFSNFFAFYLIFSYICIVKAEG